MGHPKMQVIGGEEWCSFKTLNIPAIKARIDSGAKTSSIQAANIKRFKKGRAEWVSFEINPIKDSGRFGDFRSSRRFEMSWLNFSG